MNRIAVSPDSHDGTRPIAEMHDAQPLRVKPEVRVSIIICTRDRCDSLRSTLASVGQVSVPPHWGVELVVVDNGSTDATRSVCLSPPASNFPVRYLSEPCRGKSHAYNTGIAAARGDILLFTDDDVRVPPHWIENMCTPIVAGRTDAVAGGVIFPTHIAAALSKPPLSWRRNWFASSEDLNPLAPARMIGANMAFHRRVLEKVPSFEPELGPGRLGFGEETLFSRQLLIAGYSLIGALDIAVEHHFDLSRLTNDSLLASARNLGRSHAFVFHHWEHQRSRLVLPRLMMCKLQRHWIRAIHVLSGSSYRASVLHLLKLEKEHAFYCEYLVQSRRSRKYSLRGLSPVLSSPEAPVRI